LQGKRKLLILGPSYRRKIDDDLLPALERYDGIIYRVARKYLGDVKDVDVAIMRDNLTLVDGSALVPYSKPEGENWRMKTIHREAVERAKMVNESYLRNRLRRRKYCEIFVSMGKGYAAALPELSQYEIIVRFPASGGLGPKAQALKKWFSMK